MCVNFSSRLFCMSLTESLSISTEEILLCKPFTVLFNSSILESRLFSHTRIRSNFFVTPSENFKTAIAPSSSSEIFTLGELDSFACFSSANASCKELDVLRLRLHRKPKQRSWSFAKQVFTPPYYLQFPSQEKTLLQNMYCEKKILQYDILLTMWKVTLHISRVKL